MEPKNKTLIRNAVKESTMNSICAIGGHTTAVAIAGLGFFFYIFAE
jgi:hypothetical protein